MNDNAQLYSRVGQLQKLGIIETFEKYIKLIKFKNNIKVLDVGCGDGGLTSEILVPKLPQDFQEIIGVDISEKMVTYAKEKFQANPKFDFFQFDITSETIPEKFYEYFDNVFSFYCFNWIPESKHPQALQNVHKMLKPGGYIFIVIISNSQVFDVYENMSHTEKWSPYVKNVRNTASLYHFIDNPQMKLKNFLKSAGFDCHLCTLEEKCYTFANLTHFWSVMGCFN
ncbi:juvenile hormone acid O-methyltransferase-like isoform X2 [Tribolium madens]|uniref:juvenile hormone acid O-methyltransferase-like isoform X2 n=1 Tax=Tribolium madens TaxID=41895 RepID=UPI001CF75094|nr:juvenile hormone acid O-methyltransferase-like isoform X2 [Tribolium madens]